MRISLSPSVTALGLVVVANALASATADPSQDVFRQASEALNVTAPVQVASYGGHGGRCSLLTASHRKDW